MLKVDEVVFGVVLCPMQLKKTKKIFLQPGCTVLSRDVCFFFHVLEMYGFITLKSYQGYKDSVESLSDILMAIVLSYFLA